jgi:hypothetical protein
MVGYLPDGGTTVEVDLRQVLANVPALWSFGPA